MLLMLALYRAGRRSEALNRYRTTWAYQDEEHGVTPSPELAAMRQRIDDTDPALLAEPLLGPLWVPPRRLTPSPQARSRSCLSCRTYPAGCPYPVP
jgi:DNA-binding SARP family transcriptional activator